MRYIQACLGALFLGVGISQAVGAEYPCRWVYVSRGLHQDQDVEDIRGIVKTAAEHGLNGMVLAAGLDRLDRQPAQYVQRLEVVKRACAERRIEIIPIIFSAGYGGSILAYDRNLAEGLPVKNARFLVEGKEARLQTDFPVEIPNGGFEDHTGDRVRGCQFHDLPGKVSFVDTQVAKEGQASLRFENFGQFPHGHGRVMFEVPGLLGSRPLAANMDSECIGDPDPGPRPAHPAWRPTPTSMALWRCGVSGSRISIVLWMGGRTMHFHRPLRGRQGIGLPIGRILAVCLVALPALSLPLCAQPGQSASLKATIKFPARHPYLAVTPEEVQRAKERAARYPWAKESLENLIQDARNKAARPLGKLPPKGDHAHWGIAAGLLQVGLGYAFSGDPRLATSVRDGLTAYADLYPTLEWTNRRCRVFSQSSLYEAIWAESIAQAYDLTRLRLRPTSCRLVKW